WPYVVAGSQYDIDLGNHGFGWFGVHAGAGYTFLLPYFELGLELRVQRGFAQTNFYDTPQYFLTVTFSDHSDVKDDFSMKKDETENGF
ncbi:MAG TPA: hypothetical protein VFU15_14240, partial [Bacteroidia bacterium]|nr:hypothetical protein [Bacteroidia bacterium]